MKKKALGCLLLGLISMGMCLSAPQANAYSLEELLSVSEQIQNNSPGIRFELRADKSTYSVGDPVVFNFKADKDCYLVLIDIGTSGRTIILFPNRWHPDNRIEQGKVYRIPPSGSEYGYRVEGPAGVERVKAIASLDPALSRIQSLQGELRIPPQAPPTNVQAVAVAQVFVTIRDPLTVMKDIGVEFSKIDPSKWATATLKFNVTGTGPASSSIPGSGAAAAAAATVNIQVPREAGEAAQK